eukprot:1138747-Pelagomonas_calceolata.AAC.8
MVSQPKNRNNYVDAVVPHGSTSRNRWPLVLTIIKIAVAVPLQPNIAHPFRFPTAYSTLTRGFSKRSVQITQMVPSSDA